MINPIGINNFKGIKQKYKFMRLQKLRIESEKLIAKGINTEAEKRKAERLNSEVRKLAAELNIIPKWREDKISK